MAGRITDYNDGAMVIDHSTSSADPVLYYPDPSTTSGTTTTAGNSLFVNKDRVCVISAVYQSAVTGASGETKIIIKDHAGTNTYFQLHKASNNAVLQFASIDFKIPAKGGFLVSVADSQTTNQDVKVCIYYRVIGGPKEPRQTNQF